MTAFQRDVAPLLSRYCIACHSGAKPKAGLSLDFSKDEGTALKKRDLWTAVLDRLQAREMPPPAKPQPTDDERQRLVAWIGAHLSSPQAKNDKDPGRVTVRRLNRAEYNNTIRDLVGVDFQPAKDFPVDDTGYGFDNIGDVLSLPPILLEKYLAAAEKIVEKAFQSPAARKQILIAQPNGANKRESARKIIEHFATRAYRRPVQRRELEGLMRLVDLADRNRDSFEIGIQLAMQAVLVSPHFLFRIELDPEPGNPAAVHSISEFELASRLSYFLWSSMPDEELFEAARSQKLRKTLSAHVQRMLKSSKSQALVENFAGQWLQIRNVKTATPDPRQFPSFDEALRNAMIHETELFFEAVMKEDRSILDFLEANFTFLNERLARHYGIAGIKGEQFRRVLLTRDDAHRGGILTHASFLTITSNPTRTSPVKRGKWILENILGAPPPPPPPDAGELSEDKEVVLSGSLRKRMEMHRANPNCASCHQRMDPLGFALENYDGIGAWRTHEGKFPIDPSSKLLGGESLKGPVELQAYLKGKTSDFTRCLTEKMLTYALGRGVERYDRPTVEEIGKNLAKDQYRFSALVMEIVKSDPFQKRRGQGGKK